MARRLCREHELLLDKVVAAATNYHQATLSLQACAELGHHRRFAEEIHKCEISAQEFRRAEAALRKHEASHGCGNKKEPKRAAVPSIPSEQHD